MRDLWLNLRLSGLRAIERRYGGWAAVLLISVRAAKPMVKQHGSNQRSSYCCGV